MVHISSVSRSRRSTKRMGTSLLRKSTTCFVSCSRTSFFSTATVRELMVCLPSAVYLNSQPENNWSVSRRASYFAQVFTQFIEKALSEAAPGSIIVVSTSSFISACSWSLTRVHAQENTWCAHPPHSRARTRLPRQDRVVQGPARPARRGHPWLRRIGVRQPLEE